MGGDCDHDVEALDAFHACLRRPAANPTEETCGTSDNHRRHMKWEENMGGDCDHDVTLGRGRSMLTSDALGSNRDLRHKWYRHMKWRDMGGDCDHDWRPLDAAVP
jgi:hypothetical protein